MTRARVVPAAVFAIASLLAAGIAAAAFTPPQAVSGPGAGIFPDVVLDDQGDAVLVWDRNGTVEGRRRGAGGALGPVRQIAADGSDAAVAVDADGDAVVVFVDSNDQVRLRTWSRSGVLGSTTPVISGADVASDPVVAMDDGGDAVVVWEKVRLDGNDDVRGRWRFRGGTLGAATVLSAPGGDDDDPHVDADDDDTAVVVWERSPTSAGLATLQTRRFSRNGSKSAIAALRSAPDDANSGRVAVDADGDAVIAWESVDNDGTARIRARARSRAGVLGPLRTLSADGVSPAGDAFDPDIALRAGGSGFVVWTRNDGTVSRTQIRRMTVGSVLGATQTLSRPGDDTQEPQVGVRSTGAAWVGWVTNGDLELRRRDASGSLGAIRRLSDPATDVGFDFGLAVSPGGAVATIWQYTDTATDTYTGASFGP